MSTNSFFIDLHGCAKNQVDAELINGILQALGWKRVETPCEATLIIINSCGFIEEAKKESIASIMEMHSQAPHAKIILAGCLAERYAIPFATEVPEIDAVFGNGDLSSLPHLINLLFLDSKNGQVHKNTNIIFNKKPILKPAQQGLSCGARPEFFNFRSSTYIKITEGCNNFCSFCAIPLIRGSLRSRPINDIIEEISSFLDRGVYEFNLVGQDLGVFGREGESSTNDTPSPLSILLKKIKKLKGRFVVRLLYIHPDHFPLDILPIMASDARFLPYFDNSFQSGSDNIIKKMNRCGNANSYLNLLSKIREAFKKSQYKTAFIRTTFLVGFPEENEEDFLQTKNFLKEAKCLWSGVFKYSKEEDTPSFSMKENIKEKIKKKRECILQEEQRRITQDILKTFIGRTELILIEEIIEGEGLAIGRAWFDAPEVDGSVVIKYKDDDVSIDGNKMQEGELFWCKIEAAGDVDLIGSVVGVSE